MTSTHTGRLPILYGSKFHTSVYILHIHFDLCIVLKFILTTSFLTCRFLMLLSLLLENYNSPRRMNKAPCFTALTEEEASIPCKRCWHIPDPDSGGVHVPRTYCLWTTCLGSNQTVKEGSISWQTLVQSVTEASGQSGAGHTVFVMSVNLQNVSPCSFATSGR